MFKLNKCLRIKKAPDQTNYLTLALLYMCNLCQVEARKSELKEALKHHSSSSEASSVVRTLTHLVRGVENDQFFSLSIASNGEYDVGIHII